MAEDDDYKKLMDELSRSNTVEGNIVIMAKLLELSYRGFGVQQETISILMAEQQAMGTRITSNEQTYQVIGQAIGQLQPGQSSHRKKGIL